MITFVLLSILIMGVYLYCTISKFGVPTSLSETFYLLERKWLFTAALGVADLSLLFGWLHYSDMYYPNITFLAFLCFVAILFVAVAPNFKDIQKWVHTLSAAIGGVFGIAWCLAVCWVIPVIFVIAATILTIKIKSRVVFWYEMAAFLSVYVTILYLCV